jgi:hypothetical protein
LEYQQKSSRLQRNAAAATAATAATTSASDGALAKAFNKGKAMSESTRREHNRRYMLMCVQDLRPCSMNHGDGFNVFVHGLSAAYAAETMCNSTFDKLLIAEYMTVKQQIVNELQQQYQSFGNSLPFCSLQLDMTTTNNVAFCTLSVSFVKEADDSSFTMQKVNLVTRSFPHEHTAAQVQSWIAEVTQEFFGSFMPDGFSYKDVYVAGTVDQGDNIINALKALRVPVMTCAAHRLNTAVQWAIGFAGTTDKQKTCKNPESRAVFAKNASMVSHFSYSSTRTHLMKQIQTELSEDGLQQAINLQKHQETRWNSRYKVAVRCLKLQDPLIAYFGKQTGKAADACLNGTEWQILREITSVLDVANEMNVRLQGAEGRFVSQAIFLMTELYEILDGIEIDIRNADSKVDQPEETLVSDLHPITQKVLKILLDEIKDRSLMHPTWDIERLPIILDPRQKDKKLFSTATLKDRARKELQHWHDKVANSTQAARTNLQSSAQQGAAGKSSNNTSTEQPAAKKQRTIALSAMEKRAQKRREEFEAEQAAQANAQAPALKNEVELYLSQDLVQDFDGSLDLLAFWSDKGRDRYDTTVEPPALIMPAEFPILATLARIVFSIDATSCQAERNFFILALTLDDLRASLGDCKVEQMMFLKLNSDHIPEFRAARDRKAKLEALRLATAVEVTTAVAASEGAEVA